MPLGPPRRQFDTAHRASDPGRSVCSACCRTETGASPWGLALPLLGGRSGRTLVSSVAYPLELGDFPPSDFFPPSEGVSEAPVVPPVPLVPVLPPASWSALAA